MRNISFFIFISFQIVLCNADGQALKSINDLKESFEESVSLVYQEKIFIHTDRNTYITSETIWMSAYCVDASYHQPVDVSKVLNVELIDSEGKSVKQTRIKLEKGRGKSQFFISVDLKSGRYILRGFTQWMRNFDPEFSFQKEIIIINPASPPTKPASVEERIRVNFFPEGGDLVTGIKSRVAVEIVEVDGIGVPLGGVIYDDLDNEVAEFFGSDLGLSSFWITPQPGRSYYAAIDRLGSLMKYDLPQPKSQGVVLNVLLNDDQNYLLNIFSNGQTGPLYLVVHTRGIIQRIDNLAFNQSVSIEVLGHLLKPGITHVSILNQDFMPLAERLIFKYPENQRSLTLNLSDVYTSRDKVKLTLQNMGEASGHLSISVYDKQGHIHWDHIKSSLLLTSDLKGKIERPWIYFDETNDQKGQQLDLLLMTRGWRRFSWQDLVDGETFHPSYIAETRAPIFSGSIVNRNQSGILTLTILGKSSFMNSRTLGKNGTFAFEVPSRISNQIGCLYLSNSVLESSEIEIDDPFDFKFTNLNRTPFRLKANNKAYYEELNRNIQISQIYAEKSNVNGQIPEVNSNVLDFYGEPDFIYKLDDYTRFPTVKDLFIEYINPGAGIIRKRNKEDTFYVPVNGSYSDPAFLLIDGVPFLDPEVVLNFDASKLKEIEFVLGSYVLEGTVLKGIINFRTYDGDLGGQEFPGNLIQKAYKGIQESREFYSPDYEVGSEELKRIPDHRNTLYWNPNVTLEGTNPAELEFFTSDDEGDFIVEINGITDLGDLVYEVQEFKVIKSSQ